MELGCEDGSADAAVAVGYEELAGIRLCDADANSGVGVTAKVGDGFSARLGSAVVEVGSAIGVAVAEAVEAGTEVCVTVTDGCGDALGGTAEALGPSDESSEPEAVGVCATLVTKAVGDGVTV
mmetsp:Transcript_4971/g.13387  ORF Transcript_4971/g.13387 Transcript_4971/m.13387 type:complete len:123 (+) Transcript_4971:4049-4417(+)